jgi:hypothetical protein
LSVRNEGEHVPYRDFEKHKEIIHFNKQNTENSDKRHIMTAKPLNLQNELKLLEEPKDLKNEEAKRKAYRVQRFKMLQAQQKDAQRTGSDRIDTLNNPNSNVEEFRRTMNQINIIREKKKSDLLNNNIKRSNDTEFTMYVNYGEVKIFSYRVHNETQSTKDYEVKLRLGDGFGHLKLDDKKQPTKQDFNNFSGEMKELDIVRDAAEWKYYCEDTDGYHFPSPPEYGMVVKGDVFELRPGEQVELLFKYFF